MSEVLAQLEKKCDGGELNLLKGHAYYVNGTGQENTNVDLTTPFSTGALGNGYSWSMIANKQGFSTLSFSCNQASSLEIIGLKKNGDIGTIYNAILVSGTVNLGDYDYVLIAASSYLSASYTVSLS